MIFQMKRLLIKFNSEPRRSHFHEERKLNLETFGQATVDQSRYRNNNYRGGRGGYRGGNRGGYYRNNNNNNNRNNNNNGYNNNNNGFRQQQHKVNKVFRHNIITGLTHISFIEPRPTRIYLNSPR